MRRPFARLMEMCNEVLADPSSKDVTLGQLSERWGEPAARITDAIDANKVVEGRPGYIGVPSSRDADG